MTAADPVVGVLALQGDVREHLVALAGLGVTARPVRRRGRARRPGRHRHSRRRIDHHLPAAGRLRAAGTADRSGWSAGLPAFGSCAGMIVLAQQILDGRPDQLPLRRHRHHGAAQRLRPAGGLLRDRPGDRRHPRRRGPGGVHPGALGRARRPRRHRAGRRGRSTRSRSARATCWPPRFTPRSAATTGCTPCSWTSCSARGDVGSPVEPHAAADGRDAAAIGDDDEQTNAATEGVWHSDEWPLQMGDDQAPEGGQGRQARQAVRQADQEHRGGGAHRRR